MKQREKTSKQKNQMMDSSKQIEELDNVLRFSSNLFAGQKMKAEFKKSGEKEHLDCAETVAILDSLSPRWDFEIRSIKRIGRIVAVTAAIRIDGVTREGIGTGFYQDHDAIKKAERDALIQAATKFEFIRERSKGNLEIEERATPYQASIVFPSNPIARSLSDMVTAKQLGMIRSISRKLDLDPDKECEKHMHCATTELSKTAASAFIDHLQFCDFSYGKQRAVKKAG